MLRQSSNPLNTTLPIRPSVRSKYFCKWKYSALTSVPWRTFSSVAASISRFLLLSFFGGGSRFSSGVGPTQTFWCLSCRRQTIVVKLLVGVGREGEGVRVLGRDTKGWGEFFLQRDRRTRGREKRRVWRGRGIGYS